MALGLPYPVEWLSSYMHRRLDPLLAQWHFAPAVPLYHVGEPQSCFVSSTWSGDEGVLSVHYTFWGETLTLRFSRMSHVTDSQADKYVESKTVSHNQVVPLVEEFIKALFGSMEKDATSL